MRLTNKKPYYNVGDVLSYIYIVTSEPQYHPHIIERSLGEKGWYYVLREVFFGDHEYEEEYLKKNYSIHHRIVNNEITIPK